MHLAALRATSIPRRGFTRTTKSQSLLTLTEIMSDPELMQSDDVTKLHNRMERSMMEDPTGPLAFFIPEWLQLILEGKLPSERVSDKGVHPYYEKFIVATGGKRANGFQTRISQDPQDISL